MNCLHGLLVGYTHVAVRLKGGVSDVDEIDQLSPIVLALKDRFEAQAHGAITVKEVFEPPGRARKED